MTLFYEKKEASNETIIKYKYTALIYVVVFAAFILSAVMIILTDGSLVDVVWMFVWAFIAVYTVEMWTPFREIRKAMREGNVKFSGSKFSFRNPITAVINKRSKG
ncbi:MAG: hypothetical protein ABH952_04750 [Candidatus Omnitrophota bacterium]